MRTFEYGDYIPCEDCNEGTEPFEDKLCPSCSLGRLMHLDDVMESFDNYRRENSSEWYEPWEEIEEEIDEEDLPIILVWTKDNHGNRLYRSA